MNAMSQPLRCPHCGCPWTKSYNKHEVFERAEARVKELENRMQEIQGIAQPYMPPIEDHVNQLATIKGIAGLALAPMYRERVLRGEDRP